MKKGHRDRLKWYEQKWFLFFYFSIWLLWVLLFLIFQDVSSFIILAIISVYLFVVYKRRKKGLERVQQVLNLNDVNHTRKETSKSDTSETTDEEYNSYSPEPLQSDEENNSYSSEPLHFDGNEITQSWQLERESQTVEINFSYSKVRKLVPDFTVIDFETTGLSPTDNEIIQVAAVKYRGLEKVNEFTKYVNPLVPIPKRITEITGLTDEDVLGCLTIREVLPLLLEFVGNDVLVAHNAPFDMKFLLTKMQENDLEYRKFRVIDTLSLARKNIDFTKNHKLETLKSFLKLSHLSSHEALHDCYVTGELYKYCYQENTLHSTNTN